MLQDYEYTKEVCKNASESFFKEYQDFIKLFCEQGVTLKLEFVYFDKKKCKYDLKPHQKNSFVLRCRFSLYPLHSSKKSAKANFLYQMFYVDLVSCKSKNTLYEIKTKKSTFPKKYLEKTLSKIKTSSVDKVLSQKYTDIFKWLRHGKRYGLSEQKTVRNVNLIWIYLVIILILILISTIMATEAKYPHL